MACLLLWPEINLFFICSCHLNFSSFCMHSRPRRLLSAAAASRTWARTRLSVESFYKLRLECHDIDGEFVSLSLRHRRPTHNANFPIFFSCTAAMISLPSLAAFHASGNVGMKLSLLAASWDAPSLIKIHALFHSDSENVFHALSRKRRSFNTSQKCFVSQRHMR